MFDLTISEWDVYIKYLDDLFEEHMKDRLIRSFDAENGETPKECLVWNYDLLLLANGDNDYKNDYNTYVVDLPEDKKNNLPDPLSNMLKFNVF